MVPKDYFSRTALASKKAAVSAKKDNKVSKRKAGSPLKNLIPFKIFRKEVTEVEDSAQTSDIDDEPDAEELEDMMANLDAMDDDQNHSDAITAINEEINETNLEKCPIRVSINLSKMLQYR